MFGVPLRAEPPPVLDIIFREFRSLTFTTRSETANVVAPI
jgi:hypothetical protein